MVSVSKDDVRHLATLSALTLLDEEVEALRLSLENILGYIGQLDELNTEGVEPTYQVTGLTNVWRQDEVEDSSVAPDDLLALAPESDGSSIKVPKVL